MKEPAGKGGRHLGEATPSNRVARTQALFPHGNGTDHRNTVAPLGPNNGLTKPICAGTPCPNAPECRAQWLDPHPDTGATCAHCYQVLPRFVLARIIEGRPT